MQAMAGLSFCRISRLDTSSSTTASVQFPVTVERLLCAPTLVPCSTELNVPYAMGSRNSLDGPDGVLDMEREAF